MADEIETRSSEELATIDSGLAQFEAVLLYAMSELGLPSSDVMVPVVQRGRVLRNFEDAIELLDSAQRGRSLYLSKFMVAVGAGLFDAALNYMWDETISELRRRVAGYDLAYFFEIAERDPERRKRLQTEEDLSRIDDFDLIRAANDIELISDAGHKQLDLIRYMRNFASAAHPNQNEIGAMQLLGFLETCISQVITLPETPVVVQVKRLLTNVKSQRLSPQRAAEISEFFDDLHSDGADNLAAGLFGIYTRADTTEDIRDNVRLLFPRLWPGVSEDQRQQLGVKYGRHAANGDEAEAENARALLDSVEGSQYLPEPVRVAELAEAIEDLLRAHRGWDNFYNEPPRARLLDSAVGDRGVPDGLTTDYVLAVVEVYLTNGHGASAGAEPIYESLIDRFNRREAQAAALSITNSRIAGRLQMPLPRAKFEQMLARVEPKLDRRHLEIVAAIKGSSAPLDKVAEETRVKKLINDLSAS